MSINPRIDPRSDQAAHLRRALEHARRLSEHRPGDAGSTRWSAQAAHVGDLSVLALALRD